MQLSFVELKNKDVVNVSDGKRLGNVQDVMFTKSGQITGFIVPGDRKFFKCVSRDECIFVPYCNVCKIGEDIILVELMSEGGLVKKCDQER